MERRKIQPLTLLCFSLATVCLAACSSQTNDGSIKELKYVDGSLTKTTYKVGETLDLTGLKVKLFTTTDGVTDEGVFYTNFETSVQNGYVFTENDVTSDSKYFVVTIDAKDDGIASTSVNLTVEEESKDVVRKYIDYTKDTSFKTTYEVGESLDLTGLEIKLFTETNGVVDEGVTYTDFTTNPEEGYTFVEEDISNEAEPFNLIVIPSDSSITSLTIELTVNEAEVEFVPVETTPAEFIVALKEQMTYQYDNELYSGKVTPNANYFEFKTLESASYGYAQNSSEIIRYSIQRGGIKKDQSFSRSQYASMYDTAFIQEICNPDVMPNSTAYTFPESSIEYLATLTCIEGTNDYAIDIKKAHDVIALIAPTQVPNDPYLDLSYGSDARIKLTMLTETSMRISVNNADSMVSMPVDTTITLDKNVSIPEIKDFLNNYESNEGAEVLEKIKTKLSANNYTSKITIDGTTYTTISTSDYYYTDNPNATYTNDVKIGENSIEKAEGNYNFTIENGTFKLGEQYVNSEETPYQTRMISATAIVSGFTKNFLYDAEGDLYFYELDEYDTNYYNAAPLFYALITGNAKPYKVTEMSCTYVLKNEDVESIVLDFYDGEKLMASATVNDFGTSKVDAIDSYLASIK